MQLFQRMSPRIDAGVDIVVEDAIRTGPGAKWNDKRLHNRYGEVFLKEPWNCSLREHAFVSDWIFQ